MAAIGSGINPALGRVDYSPFLQGAQMAAQGRIQGSNALAEGVSQGFQDYLKKREQNAILEGKNNALLRDISQNPQLAASPEIQKYTAKMAKGGGLTLNDNIKLNAELTTTVEAERNRQEQQARSLQMKVNQFQLDKAQADNQRAENDRRAMSSIWAEAGKTGKIPDQDDTIRLGIYYGLSPEGIASMLGVSQNSIEFGAKMAQTAAVVDKLKAENTEVAARNDRISQALKLMPNGFREYDDGKTKVFQYIDYASGQVKSEMLKAGQVPASIQQLKVKQEDMTKLVTEYQQLMASPQRDSQENVKRRELLTQQYNLILPNADIGRSNMTRKELDKMFGIQSVLTKTETEATKPPPPTPSNIRGVSTAAPGAQPTPAAAPAAAVPTAAAAQGGFNLIDDMRRTFAGRAQAAPVTTPAVDTTVAAPTPAAPPPVDLSAPASISGVIPFGPAGMERGEGADVKPTPVVARALASAVRWADKNLTPEKAGLGALAQALNEPAFKSARAMELSYAQFQSENSDTPSKTFDEQMTNFGYRKSKDGNWDYKGPAYRGGANPEKGRPSASIPFGPAAMDSTFLDREAQATVQDIYRPFDVSLMERGQPQSGGIPQIKLSPAAQKIASELRRSSEEGKRERGKAPQFFLEVSSGDDGRRTRERIKLEENELFGILNSRSPSLAPQLYIDKEASWQMTGRKTGNFRPPPLRAR